MKRSEFREQVFKLLFRVEFNSMEEMDEQAALFFETQDEEVDEKNAEAIRAKYEKVVSALADIDLSVNEKSEGWSTDRMGKVELAIIRLAVYEILYDDDIPNAVAINEAVELAKKFGSDSSGSFVNGILAKFVKT